MEIKYRKLSDIVPHPDNPRRSDEGAIERLAESIRKNPQFFEARPILLSDRTGDLVIIGGQRRFEAAASIGLKKVPTILLPGLDEETEREIIIRDNTHSGEWDAQLLRGWDIESLQEWGVDVSIIREEEEAIDPDSLGDDFSLPDGEKDDVEHVSFVLSSMQAQEVRDALAVMKKKRGEEVAEYDGNTNKNGNAIYFIVKEWAEQRK